ncbi:MAG TPA: hypothetical protein VL995_06800 [Cellvibrio sp.]|nr:hypothetical protein [Cellvibrio sp.]
MKLFTLDGRFSLEKFVADQIAAFTDSKDSFAVSFLFHQFYLPEQSHIELTACLYVDQACASSLIYLSIFPSKVNLTQQIQSVENDLNSFKAFITTNDLPIVEVSAPWILEPVYIPKPWGQEIWYTGIEARGQAKIKGMRGSIPLPWVMAAFPQADHGTLILLKVLDPLPDDVYGDLYFELHEKKQEVYVVTHIDPSAWPNGDGCIQLGFSDSTLALYPSVDEFKKAYLESVKFYEEVRRKLDQEIDTLREQDGIARNAPVSAEKLKYWINCISQSSENKTLLKQESVLRNRMNSFVNHLPLKVGDTLAVPCHVPHALQHGVRVIEFQTPVYERKILSFAQKVLTQEHWDTEEALSLVDFTSNQRSIPKLIAQTDSLKQEEIVHFDDFTVHRFVLSRGSFRHQNDCYSLVVVIRGKLELTWGMNRKEFQAGESLLLSELLGEEVNFTAADSCLFLLAFPSVQ